MKLEEDAVAVERGDLEALLRAMRNVRSGFLLCAPRFAAGSQGESLVAEAANSAALIAKVERLLATGETTT